MIRVVIIGQDSIVRSSIKSYLMAQNSLELLPVTEIRPDLQATFNNLQPDVVVMDLLKPDVASIQSICDIAQKIPEIRIIVLAAYYDEECVLEMLQRGIRSYLSLDTDPEELLKAIHEVSQGRRYLTNMVYNRVLECILERSPGVNNSNLERDSNDRLTAREHEVINLVAEGYTCREIAKQLCVSPRTVETHRANVMHKLGLSSHIELLRYAISHGILPVE